MILKNGKRIDGMGDSMPIGSVIEYNGTDIPDGWEQIEETPKVVACNYSDWQEQQVIEGTGAGATITGFETTLTTTRGNILVSVTVPITKTGGTCWLNIYVDGTKMMQYGISGSGGILSYTNVFPVSPGLHTVSAAIHNNNVQTVTIYNYTSRAFTVAEV